MRNGLGSTDKGQLERVARMYASNEDAARALGIVMRSFSRLCRQHGIETPYARRQRQRREAKSGRTDRATMGEV